MNPLLGRWVSADPLAVHAPGEADLNVYAYVKGAVLKAIDPLGLQDEAPVESFLTVRDAQIRGWQGTARDHMVGLRDVARQWEQSSPDRRAYYVRADDGTETGAASGVQHLRAIGSMARQGATEGRSQHLHIMTHGGLSGQDGEGNPENAGIILGGDRDNQMRITTAHLKADPQNLASDADRAEVNRMNRELDALKAELAEANVTDITIHGCNVGRSQEFLNALSERLGVNVHGFDSTVRTPYRTQNGERIEGSTREGIGGRARFDGSTGEWVDGPNRPPSAPAGELMQPNAHSDPRSSAGDSAPDSSQAE